jgi:hypothetical protein
MTDYEVILALTKAAMQAYIMADPKLEWTKEEIAEMAVDQALAVQLELKGRKNDKQKNNSDEPFDSRSKTPMSGFGPGVSDQRVRGPLARKGDFPTGPGFRG